MRRDIEYTNLRMAIYYNNRYKKEPDFKEGDKVYLLRRNIKTKRPCEKLDSRKIGPFEILRKKGELNYELNLPNAMRSYPVFHVALLEPAPENAELQTEIEIDIEEEKEYEIEEILEQGGPDGRPLYLVK